jgi:hypothetical protein
VTGNGTVVVNMPVYSPLSTYPCHPEIWQDSSVKSKQVNEDCDVSDILRTPGCLLVLDQVAH